MNIAIIGAGNIGTYLATYISLKEGCKVWMHTSKPESFKETLTLVEEEKNLNHKVNLHCVSSSLEEVVKDADYILITHPSFMMEKTLKEIGNYVKQGAAIGCIPGFGGKEYYSKPLIEKGCIFFGSQRVPSITRLISYGESVCLKQKNPFMKLGVIPKEAAEKVCKDMTNLIDIPSLPVENYLAITLSPSNPTMHPSRLYELFGDYKEGIVYTKNPLFYEEWNTIASSTLLDLDVELAAIFKELNEFNDFNPNDFEKIKVRYGIETPEELSQKIRTASGFKGIHSPMVEVKNGHIPDLNSRYFIEDVDFGLCILKSFAELVNIQTPTIDKLIYWSQDLLGKEYLVNGHLTGADSKNLIIPQNLGVKTKEELVKYYKSL